MSPLQERAAAFIERIKHLDVIAECTDGRHLIARGHGGLYYVDPDGNLTRCDPHWGAEGSSASSGTAEGQ